jgi:hypothetical protein
MSDEDIGHGQSMDKTHCLSISQKKCIEELTIASDDSDDSDDQEDKVTTIKEKKKQTTQEYEKVYSVLNVVYTKKISGDT